MGEVYRARDTKLGREVALKLLPAAFAGDAERLGRFQREAQALAALNHPHIAQIHGLEESGSLQALVMELVEGPTLAEVIAGAQPGPGLGVGEAIRIARQIALALEAAHGRGITHRDLKPSNIKIAPDGSVKVLDFGLAKLSSPLDSSQRPPVDLSASPTLTSPVLATGVGMILGTAAYMSPEQARGKAVDKRADVWGFGCVFYEMLTGRRAFEGEDVSDTLAGVLRGEPDWSLLPPELSPTLRVYLRRCLARDAAQRVHDIADVRLALEGAFDVPIETGAPVPAAASGPRGLKPALYGLGLLLAAAAGGLALWALRTELPSAIVRLSVVPSNGAAIAPTQGDPDVAVSPDGSRIAFVNIEEGALVLHVRALGSLDVLRIMAVGPRSPFFSPDGQTIGYFDGDGLKRVAATGGPAVTIAPASGTGRGASWGADDSIIFATSSPTGLMRVAASGGEPTELTKPNPGEDHILPHILPGGRGVLFTIASTGGLISGAQIAVLDLESGTHRAIIPGGSHASYAPSGHLVYGYSGTLRAVGFDLDTLVPRGNPVPVLDRVITKITGPANFALSSSGVLAYTSGDAAANVERVLVWVDRKGGEEVLPAPKRAYTYPRISPDGTKVALDIRDQENDIWTWDLARQTLARLTFDPGLNRGVVWTPDGSRVVFSAVREDGLESLFWQASDGSGAPERLTTATVGRPQVPYSFSRDGSVLIFGEPGQPPFDLFTLPIAGDRKPMPLLNASHSENNGEVSPDGRWLVYQSDESGRNEIYVRRYPELDSRSQISTDGGTRPMWARSGRELFYMKGDGTMMAVPVQQTEAGGFSAGTPAMLFGGQYFTILAGRTYDVSPDGSRFLMVRNAAPSTGASAPQLVVVLNWQEELKRLAPVD
jgi:serine/threonine-protein kinase